MTVLETLLGGTAALLVGGAIVVDAGMSSGSTGESRGGTVKKGVEEHILLS